MGNIKIGLLFLFLGFSSFTFAQKDLEKIKTKIIGKWKHQDKDLRINFIDFKLMKTNYGSNIVDHDDYFISKLNDASYLLSIRMITGQRYKYELILKKDILTLIPVSSKNSEPHIYTRIEK